MVIPVCFKCLSPVEFVSDSSGGVEVIRYRCIECDHSAASFLLGYTESEEKQGQNLPEVDSPFGQRAQFFGESNEHYKLRAKMQGLLELRAAADGRRQDKTAPPSSAAEDSEESENTD